MTITDDQIRAALDHRLRAAGFDDRAAVPAPTTRDLRLLPTTARPRRGRRLATIAAALLLVAGATALVATRRDAPTGTQTETTTTSAAAPTTTEPNDDRPELPPPWPRLDAGPQSTLDLHGDPIDSMQEFSERLPELDAQTKAGAAAGRMNVVDDLTGEVVNVDEQGYWAQWFEVTDWYREHLGSDDQVLAGDQDPAIVFTDGSFRLIYRSDLSCSPNADGHRPIACLQPTRDEEGNVTGLAPGSGEQGN